MLLTVPVLRHFGPGAFGKERPFEDLVKEEAEFKNKTVDDVMSYPGIGEKSYYHALTKDYSGMACVEALVREPGNRRVLILDDRRNKKPVNLVRNPTLPILPPATRSINGSRLFSLTR